MERAVVVAANFLIDAESNIRAALAATDTFGSSALSQLMKSSGPRADDFVQGGPSRPV